VSSLSAETATAAEPQPAADARFLRSARTVTMLTMLSRVLGLVRDQLTAALLGAGAVSDALTWAWTIPNAFRRLFGEGALSSALVPVFSRVLEKDGKPRAREMANQVVSTLAVFLLIFSLALAGLVALVPPDAAARWLSMDAEKARLTLGYTELLLPYLAIICVIAQFMAVMNALGEFAIPASASVILNLVWSGGVAAAWLLWGAARAGTGADPRPAQGFLIAGAILVSGVLQFLWHLPGLRRLGVGFRFTAPRRTPELREVMLLMGPMLLGMGASQLQVIVDRTIALAFLDDGGTTHIYYGLRLMQFPQGLVTAALVSAVFPTLARLSARGESQAVAATTGLALRVNTLLTLPAAAGLIVLAQPIVQLLLQHGEFRPENTAPTAQALAGFALGIPAAGAVMVLTRAFYAVGDVRTPVRIGLWTVALNVVLALLLVGPLEELGLALATSAASILTAGLLLWSFRKRTKLPPGQGLLHGLQPLLLLTVAMGAAVWLLDAGLLRLLPPTLLGSATVAVGLRVALGIGVGAVLYLLLAVRLCPQEWAALRPLLRRRSGEA
jgi:putative peptidoglycan lipid II flippase